jgi:hypothetical protein
MYNGKTNKICIFVKIYQRLKFYLLLLIDVYHLVHVVDYQSGIADKK